MAADDGLGAVKAENNITSEEQKSIPKEHFTLEGSVLINIRWQLYLRHRLCRIGFDSMLVHHTGIWLCGVHVFNWWLLLPVRAGLVRKSITSPGHTGTVTLTLDAQTHRLRSIHCSLNTYNLIYLVIYLVQPHWQVSNQ